MALHKKYEPKSFADLLAGFGEYKKDWRQSLNSE